jgi:TetR/AcrR family transcriptional regulator, regulator of autoinduction and epiphytic fitness
MSTVVARPSFKEQMLAAREEAIIQNVNRLLAEKGFDAMTVDEVAAAVGIAKASLYKHFPSKEDLAAAAMVRVMLRAQQFLAGIDAALPVLEKLKSVVRWTLQVQLAGQMPSLPSQNSSLRAALMSNRDYLDALVRISDQLGEWIESGQRERVIDPQLPPLAVLYTLYARACDPVVEFLRAGGQHSDEQIVDLVLSTCFNGLSAR